MKESIQSQIHFSDESYQLFLNTATKRKAKRKQVLFYPDKASNKILFITKGLLRGYKIIEGKEYTHHFYFADWFATDFESFLTEKPSQIYIETVEDTDYFEFHKNDLLSLYSQCHQLEALGRIIAEKAYLATVEKLSNMQIFSLNERYERLIKNNPNLIQRVPQKHIASYLGVSEQSLSRIKSF